MTGFEIVVVAALVGVVVGLIAGLINFVSNL